MQQVGDSVQPIPVTSPLYTFKSRKTLKSQSKIMSFDWSPDQRHIIAGGQVSLYLYTLYAHRHMYNYIHIHRLRTHIIHYYIHNIHTYTYKCTHTHTHILTRTLYITHTYLSYGHLLLQNGSAYIWDGFTNQKVLNLSMILSIYITSQREYK